MMDVSLILHGAKLLLTPQIYLREGIKNNYHMIIKFYKETEISRAPIEI